jgi:hypothetical protein
MVQALGTAVTKPRSSWRRKLKRSVSLMKLDKGSELGPESSKAVANVGPRISTKYDSPKRSPRDLIHLCGESKLNLPFEYAVHINLRLPTCFRALAYKLSSEGMYSSEVISCILMIEGLNESGIFRLSGSKEAVDKICNYYIPANQNASSVDSSTTNPTVPPWIDAGIHDVATAFKRLLAGLSGGILGDSLLLKALATIHYGMGQGPEPTREHTRLRARLIALIFKTIPDQPRRELIYAVFGLLSMIGRQAEIQPHEDQRGNPLDTSGLMGYKNLAVIFGPLLLGEMFDNFPIDKALLYLPPKPQVAADKKSKKHSKNKKEEIAAKSFYNIQLAKARNDLCCAVVEMIATHWRDIIRQSRDIERRLLAREGIASTEIDQRVIRSSMSESDFGQSEFRGTASNSGANRQRMRSSASENVLRVSTSAFETGHRPVSLAIWEAAGNEAHDEENVQDLVHDMFKECPQSPNEQADVSHQNSELNQPKSVAFLGRALPEQENDTSREKLINDNGRAPNLSLGSERMALELGGSLEAMSMEQGNSFPSYFQNAREDEHPQTRSPSQWPNRSSSLVPIQHLAAVPPYIIVARDEQVTRDLRGTSENSSAVALFQDHTRSQGAEEITVETSSRQVDFAINKSGNLIDISSGPLDIQSENVRESEEAGHTRLQSEGGEEVVFERNDQKARNQSNSVTPTSPFLPHMAAQRQGRSLPSSPDAPSGTPPSSLRRRNAVRRRSYLPLTELDREQLDKVEERLFQTPDYRAIQQRATEPLVWGGAGPSTSRWRQSFNIGVEMLDYPRTRDPLASISGEQNRVSLALLSAVLPDENLNTTSRKASTSNLQRRQGMTDEDRETVLQVYSVSIAEGDHNQLEPIFGQENLMELWGLRRSKTPSRGKEKGMALFDWLGAEAYKERPAHVIPEHQAVKNSSGEVVEKEEEFSPSPRSSRKGVNKAASQLGRIGSVKLLAAKFEKGVHLANLSASSHKATVQSRGSTAAQPGLLSETSVLSTYTTNQPPSTPGKTSTIKNFTSTTRKSLPSTRQRSLSKPPTPRTPTRLKKPLRSTMSPVQNPDPGKDRNPLFQVPEALEHGGGDGTISVIPSQNSNLGAINPSKGLTQGVKLGVTIESCSGSTRTELRSSDFPIVRSMPRFSSIGRLTNDMVLFQEPIRRGNGNRVMYEELMSLRKQLDHEKAKNRYLEQEVRVRFDIEEISHRLGEVTREHRETREQLEEARRDLEESQDNARYWGERCLKGEERLEELVAKFRQHEVTIQNHGMDGSYSSEDTTNSTGAVNHAVNFHNHHTHSTALAGAVAAQLPLMQHTFVHVGTGMTPAHAASYVRTAMTAIQAPLTQDNLITHADTTAAQDDLTQSNVAQADSGEDGAITVDL